MKKRCGKGLLFAFLAALMLIMLRSVPSARGAEEEAFSLMLETEYGTISGAVNGGKCTLFVPAGVTEKELVLSYTGTARASTAGELDREARTLTIPNEDGLAFTLQMTDRPDVRITVLKSSMPSVVLTLKETDLETVHADKSLSYTGNTVSVIDPGHPEYCFTDTDCTFHGRGNSSWAYFEKRGYMLKFSEKQPLLGMDASRGWCLIGNANDGTLMKNRIAYEIAKAGNFLWSPDCAFADLWINGDYRGLYLITDQVELGQGRLDLRDRNAVLMELDNMFYMDSDLWFESDVTGMHFTVKDAMSDGALGPVRLFKEKYEAFERLLHTQDPSWEALCRYVDMPSFAEYYLLNEMLLNKEILCTSLYLYMDGEQDVIHAGPVWDFDTCMNSTGDAAGANALQYMGSTYFDQTDLFALLCSHPEFVEQVTALYEEKYRGILEKIPLYMEEVAEEIQASAGMNFVRFPKMLGSVTVKGDIIGSSFEENVKSLSRWFVRRAELFVPAVVRSWPLGQTERGDGRGIVRTADLLSYYAPVFSPAYYAEKNPDLVRVYGSDPGAMLLHFLNYGVISQRPCHRTFDLSAYISGHPELWSVYGSDRLKYAEHYIESLEKKGESGSPGRGSSTLRSARHG